MSESKHRDMELGAAATAAAGAGTYHSPRTRRADPTTTNIHTELSSSQTSIPHHSAHPKTSLTPKVFSEVASS